MVVTSSPSHTYCSGLGCYTYLCIVKFSRPSLVTATELLLLCIMELKFRQRDFLAILLKSMISNLPPTISRLERQVFVEDRKK